MLKCIIRRYPDFQPEVPNSRFLNLFILSIIYLSFTIIYLTIESYIVSFLSFVLLLWLELFLLFLLPVGSTDAFRFTIVLSRFFDQLLILPDQTFILNWSSLF